MSAWALANSGAMRYRVQFFEPRESRNQTGEVTFTWVPAFGGPLWAAVENLSGREVIQNQRQEFTLSHRIVIRGRGDKPPFIHPQYKASWGGRELEIQNVLSMDRGRWIELLCSEIRSPKQTRDVRGGGEVAECR